MNYLDICKKMDKIPEFTPSYFVKQLMPVVVKKIYTSDKDKLAHELVPTTYMLNINYLPDECLGLIEIPKHIEMVKYIMDGFEYYLLGTTTSYTHISGDLYLINIKMYKDLFTVAYVTFPSHDSAVYSIHYPCNISDISSKYYNQVEYNKEIGNLTTKTIGVVTDTIINELKGNAIIMKTLCYNFILTHITSKSSKDVRCHGYYINGKIVIKKIAFSEKGANSFEVNRAYLGTSSRIMVETKSFEINDYEAMVRYVRY